MFDVGSKVLVRLICWRKCSKYNSFKGGATMTTFGEIPVGTKFVFRGSSKMYIKTDDGVATAISNQYEVFPDNLADIKVITPEEELRINKRKKNARNYLRGMRAANESVYGKKSKYGGWE